MKNKKKIPRRFILYIVIVAVFGMLASNPLRWSTESISNHVQRRIPLGTDINEVVRKLEKHWKWKIREINDYGVQMIRGKPYHGFTKDRDTLFGEKSIEIYLGGYQDLPFRKNVCAFLIFDENDKLIEVAVYKVSDSL